MCSWNRSLLSEFDEVLGALYLISPRHEAAQPRYLLLVAMVPLPSALLFIAPVSRDAVLGKLVHLVGAYLYLQRLVLYGPHGGVERLVHRLFGARDVVIELAGDGRPERVDDTKRGVAVLYRVDHDTHGQHIIYVLKGAALALHLLPEGVDMLDAALYGGLYTSLAEALFEVGDHALQVAVTSHLGFLEHGGKLVVRLRVDIGEGEVFKLALYLPHAEAIGEGGVYLKGLEGDALLLLAGYAL